MISAFGVDHGFISKADRQKEKDVAAIAGGAVAGQGVYQGAGYGLKHYNQKTNFNRFKNSKGKEYLVPKGWSRSKYDRFNSVHTAKYGNRTAKYMRKMPKEVPGSNIFHILGYTHRGKTGVALGTAATVGGAATGYSLTHKKGKQ